MSYYIDVKYLQRISYKLPLFKKKSDILYNCRCIICGDSSTNKRKARGYFFKKDDSLIYKCHNCDYGTHFGAFLKNLDSFAYSEYSLEKYSKEKPKVIKDASVEKLESKFKIKDKCFLDELMIRVSQLPKNHFCRKYCETRKIPKKQFDNLYFIDDVRNIEQLNEGLREHILEPNPRLIIPARDIFGKVIGMTARALDDSKLRYIIIKIGDNPTLFGLDKVDFKKHIYVVEGPIDSLFLPNSIAVGGTGFLKLFEAGFSKDSLTIILDNQPRNLEVVKIYNKILNLGYKIFFWPDIDSKDINDLVLNYNYNEKQLIDFIDSRSYNELRATIEFNKWKKV